MVNAFFRALGLYGFMVLGLRRFFEALVATSKH